MEERDPTAVIPERLAAHVAGRRLDTTAILATKLHAILDRGTRRDFFDLYVTLSHHGLGLASCLAAMREVFGQRVSEPLLLRALTHFDDAEAEAALPGEGPHDWAAVKDFFLTRVGSLLVPPPRPLAIQARVVDVRGSSGLEPTRPARSAGETAREPPESSSRSRRTARRTRRRTTSRRTRGSS